MSRETARPASVAAAEIGGIPIKKKGRFEASRPTRRPTSAEKAENARNRRKGSAGGKVAIVLASLVILAALGVCSYGYYLRGSDTIFPNVYVANVNVGGLTHDAAVSAIRSEVDQSYTGDLLTVTLPDRTISIAPEVTQEALNPEQAADAAMLYGRDGGPINALLTYLYAKDTDYTVKLDSVLNLDTAYIRDIIDQTARACASEKIEPIVKVDEENRRIQVTTGSPGIHLNADALYEAALNRFAAGDFSDLAFDYDVDPCALVDLQGYYDTYCENVKDAYYDTETHEIVEEQVGYGFDPSYYAQQIAMAKPGSVITIQLEPIEPEVTKEQLSQIYFADVLGSCDSPHTANADRTNNLTLACKAIDGTIVDPGEEFSFNRTVGERTPENGYRKATVYATGGISEPDYGGGVCQVASTIYVASLYANVKVTQRAPHMYLVTYVEAGMDATIYWPSMDYRFVNNTEYPIRIDASVSGGYVHIKLIGTKTDQGYAQIKLRHETVSSLAAKLVIDKESNGGVEKEITIVKGGGIDASGNPIDIAVDADGNKYVLGAQVNSPYDGYTVKAYRGFYDAEGNLLREELLHTDTYSSRNRSFTAVPYVEPIIQPEPEPEPEPDPEPGPDDPNPDDGGEDTPYNPFDPGTWWTNP